VLYQFFFDIRRDPAAIHPQVRYVDTRDAGYVARLVDRCAGLNQRRDGKEIKRTERRVGKYTPQLAGFRLID
jgi:hypothetical protein